MTRPLPISCERALPYGAEDTSTFEEVERALDEVKAPCLDRAGRWLTLPDRVRALARELVERARVGR